MLFFELLELILSVSSLVTREDLIDDFLFISSNGVIQVGDYFNSYSRFYYMPGLSITLLAVLVSICLYVSSFKTAIVLELFLLWFISLSSVSYLLKALGVFNPTDESYCKVD